MGTAWRGAGGQLVAQHARQGEFPVRGRVLGNPDQVRRGAFRTDLIVGSATPPDRTPGDGPAGRFAARRHSWYHRQEWSC